MPDKKISQLTNATTPLAGTETLPIVQSGSTVKVSVANLTASRAVSAQSLTLNTTGIAAEITHGATNIWGCKVIASGSAELQFSGDLAIFSGPSIRAVTSGGAAYTSLCLLGSSITFRYGSTIGAVLDASGNFLVSGAGGLGYGTGSGGAVTQGTSRTQGVTLDKTNGAITLFSAAGTTTWQSFTVTNNKVAATDTVIVNQKSGTDLYQIFVTNVAAGSFKITFATTGGTTTEQPVFNFAVIKAVTS